MLKQATAFAVGAVALGIALPGIADVFSMGPDLASLEWVSVGNPGNSADMRYASDGRGRVDYTYEIGKYEVTAGQYCDFLNSAARSADPHALYHWRMGTSHYGGCMIQRGGQPGNYTYTVPPDYANRPVNYVNCFNAIRFCNWLTNGATADADTETGSYDLTKGETRDVRRTQGARYVLPSEDEWYKAAYYAPALGTYYDYPTGRTQPPDDNPPDQDTGNSANYYIDHQVLGPPYWRVEVGAYGLTKSPYGVYNMAGNVSEWSETLGSVEGGSHSAHGDVMMRPWPQWWVTPVYFAGWAFGFRVAEVPERATVVGIDIKPGSWPNPLNTKSRGVLPLAVCGTEDLDVTTIDPGTVLLGREGFDLWLAPLRWSVEDVATPYDNGQPGGHDLDGDGFPDLALKFSTEELAALLGLGGQPGNTIPLTLTGTLIDEAGGAEFEGLDWIWVLRTGDANLDGFVDIQDFYILKDHFALGAGWSEGDFNEDGIVDIQDFYALKGQFGTGGAAVSAIPEPATLALLAFGGVPMLRTRRRAGR